MKILIIGASGLVGGRLYHDFQKNHQVIGTYNSFFQEGLVKLDITNQEEVEKLIKRYQPDWILLPASFADVDGCEKNPSLCYRINRQGVKNVVDLAGKNQIPLVFFSTDYIFDGKKGPYKEDDRPNPLNIYGKVKLEMENYIKDNLNKYLIIRTCNVFGWEPQGKNFVIRLISKLKGSSANSEQIPVDIVTDQTGSPTYVGALTRAVKYLVENNYHGIYNIAGRETVSRYQFALETAKVFGLRKSLIRPVTTDKINQTALRPKKAGLRIDKVQKILPFRLPGIREGLETMKREKLIDNA